jgi:hypothetical protein
VEAAIGIEPMNKGFADLCLTAWLRRPINARCTNETEQCGAIEIITSIAPHKPKLLFALSPARNPKSWSGRRDLNSRLSPWQGDTLPLSYSRFGKPPLYESSCHCQAQWEHGPRSGFDRESRFLPPCMHILNRSAGFRHSSVRLPLLLGLMDNFRKRLDV